MPQNTHVQNVLALSIVVIIDWFIAHLATSWVMPPEVAQAFQTLVSVAIGAWVARDKITLPDVNGHDDTPIPPVVQGGMGTIGPSPLPPAPPPLPIRPETAMNPTGSQPVGGWPPKT